MPAGKPEHPASIGSNSPAAAAVVADQVEFAMGGPRRPPAASGLHKS